RCFALALVAVGVGSLGFAPRAAQADLRLPVIFSSHLLLQRDVENPLWGTTDADEKLTIRFDDKVIPAQAGSDGRWAVKLPATAAGGPHKITIEDATGENKITLSDVLFGELWVCSGQSNMEMNLSSTDRAQADVPAANHPQIRLFTIPHLRGEQPQEDCVGRWSPCTPAVAGGFSATAYYFGADLQKALGVPIGLIHTSWGGTPAESWTPRPALEAQPGLKYMAGGGSQLYNGMIHPLVRLPIAGCIWYQGEANVGRAAQYRKLFPTMIEAWRQAWQRPDLPFYFVQIAPYRYNADNGQACAELWDAQFQTMQTVPHTGMAVVTDSDSVDDIHPRNKKICGERLARWALAKTYGKADLVYSGPIFKKAEPEVQVDADKIRLSFDSVGGGLASRDGKPLTDFTIAGADERFVSATAVIEGDTVLVHADSVAKPQAVRFGWKETAHPNLINKEGLPASPFRTDDWKLVTEGRK
ncbi:MAG TPA: sialate O-acetylesterase, partial [Pirellulales bacterium]|nr:sialate O-acetylesterase [Pirellulales bacterium]